MPNSLYSLKVWMRHTRRDSYSKKIRQASILAQFLTIYLSNMTGQWRDQGKHLIPTSNFIGDDLLIKRWNSVNQIASWFKLPDINSDFIYKGLTTFKCFRNTSNIDSLHFYNLCSIYLNVWRQTTQIHDLPLPPTTLSNTHDQVGIHLYQKSP